MVFFISCVFDLWLPFMHDVIIVIQRRENTEDNIEYSSVVINSIEEWDKIFNQRFLKKNCIISGMKQFQ